MKNKIVDWSRKIRRAAAWRSASLLVLTPLIAAVFVSACGKSPLRPDDVQTVPTAQASGRVPQSLAEAKLRQTEIQLPSIDGLVGLLEPLLSENADPTERELLEAVWPTLREARLAATTSSVYPYRATSEEFWLLMAYPKYALTTKRAGDDASLKAIQVWPGDQADTKADAFRHGFWNVLLAKRVALWWAIAFTDAHESESPNNNAKRMDLNNNAVGQDIFIRNPQKTEAELATILKNWTYVYVTTVSSQKRSELVYFKK